MGNEKSRLLHGPVSGGGQLATLLHADVQTFERRSLLHSGRSPVASTKSSTVIGIG